MCTKFYQNRRNFVEDMTKTFGCVFSVHSVDMAAAQTGSTCNTVSAHRTAKTKFQRLHPDFLCRPVQRYCRQHNQKSYYTGNRQSGHPKQKSPNLLQVQKQQYFYFRFTVMSKQLDFVVTEQKFDENSETFVEILRLYFLQPEMQLLPVWMSVISISIIRQHPTIQILVLLNCWTSKTQVQQFEFYQPTIHGNSRYDVSHK